MGRKSANYMGIIHFYPFLTSDCRYQSWSIQLHHHCHCLHVLVVEGIDVFSARKQWAEAWNDSIEPYLVRQWQRRIGLVNSRPAKRLGWSFEKYLDAYRLVRRKDYSTKDALEHVALKDPEGGPDEWSLLRVFKTMDALTKPNLPQ